MYRNPISILSVLLFSVFILFSCSEDELSTEDSILNVKNFEADRRGDGRDQGRHVDDVSSESSDVIKQWIALFLELDRYADGMRPNASARALAYINLAAYETAVIGMRDFQSNSGRISGFRKKASTNKKNINWELALNSCYAEVLEHFLLNVPDNLLAKIDELETQIESSVGDSLRNQDVQNSQRWGRSVARDIIAYSQTDAEAESQVLEPQPLSYEPPTSEGYWIYSAEPERALFPYWESVRTFVVSADQTTSLPPLSYSEDTDSPYFQEMTEVYNANNDAKDNNSEELWIAEFWSDDVGGLTFGPPSRQFSISNQLIDYYQLNMEEALHMNLKLGFALNDAAVSTWKYKYEHMVMRPSVYIHEFIDPSYQTNLYRLIPWPNPSFPGYPSGHSCFASAAAGVFIDFFGNEIDFTDQSHEGRTEFQGSARSFDSFEEMARENALSRIPLGVHIRMDCTEGLRLGYEISDGINKHRVKRRSA